MMNDYEALMVEQVLKNLYKEFYKVSDVRLDPLAGSGSDRRYFRLSSEGVSCIGTYVPDALEGRCFVRLARDFRANGVSVPEIYAVSSDFHCYLQEDLGDVSLFSVIGQPASEKWVRETLGRLVSLQKVPEAVWRDDCFNRGFSRRQAMWDLNYFKYEYLKPALVVFDEDELEDDFERLSDVLANIPEKFCGFMMRDCQSRNVMLTESGPVFIDFQGGRRGPALYDAVSFLWQARAAFSEGFRMSMLDYYCDVFCDGDLDLKAEMLSSLGSLVLFRTLQVLGAYGFRGLVQNKSHFLLSIPGALANLKALLDSNVLDSYPQLKRVAEDLTADPMFRLHATDGRLVVEVFSFSYKKGYPRDMSGNGGGFMFDCRALHNPGRYREYRDLTGRDIAVREFLESRGEVKAFLGNVWALTDASVERYLSRGFTHIQFGFGCTGGQHRSVYCAERTADHLRVLFPEAVVNVVHREHPV